MPHATEASRSQVPDHRDDDLGSIRRNSRGDRDRGSAQTSDRRRDFRLWFLGDRVALFGGLHPAGIVPAAFFFGLLIYGADMTQRLVGVPANMVQVLQGIIILVIVATKMILKIPISCNASNRSGTP